MDKPAALPVKLANIPPALRAIPRWVNWKYVKRKKPDGGFVWAKLPVTSDGRAASSTDPKTWTTFDAAFDALLVNDVDGVGLVLGDDVQGIDIDDCRDPNTGELSDFGRRVLDGVAGYAEVSPSGTGIKIFTRSNLDISRTKKEVGLELYCAGRYFTVTGHQLNGHEALPDQVQDLSWLIREVFDEEPAGRPGDAFENLKSPLDGWDIDRVMTEVMTHLDPNCGYDEWLRIGAALHHQGEGAEDWLELWDSWSSGGSTYAEGVCAEKWDSFSQQRARGAVTLASLLHMTKDKRQETRAVERRSVMDELLEAVANAAEPRELKDVVARRASQAEELGDIEREQLAGAIQARARALDPTLRLPIGDVRRWLRPPVQASGWQDVNDDGLPLCTLENLRVLLARLGYTVRYNVIKKSIEIMIPGSGFSRDNRDNAAISEVLSQCERVRMPTKHVAQYLIRIADENPYNPVATWIESRPWDGVSRLEAFYSTVRSPNDPKLKKKLLRKWLIQCVAAAFAPDGIAGQGILTFVGPQNIGKTTWFRRLAPAELDVILTGHTLDTRSKDSIFIALAYWIVELGEVDATMRKSDISALKSFVTQLLDKIRRPYAATESEYCRRTVFGATVNDMLYLHDPTGNRRFWSIEVEGFDLDHDIDMQQLWAEVLELWRAGEKFNLDQEDVAELNAHNEDFTALDPIEENLAGLGWGTDPEKWEWVTATEALLRIGLREPTRNQVIVAARVLAKLNGGRRRRSNGRVMLALPPTTADFMTG